MSFLTTIRNSFNGTTQFYQKDVKGRWGFSALFLLVFGIIQILALLIFFFIYAGVTDNSELGMQGVLEDLATGQMQFVLQFISLYMLLFMVVMLKKGKVENATELKFGDLFQLIPGSTFIVYLVSVLLSLLGMLYFSSHMEYYFFEPMGDGFIQAPFYAEEKWYWVLLKNLSVFLLRYLPAIVLGYYMVSLKEGKWKWEFIKTKWSQAMAILVISIMFIGLYETVAEFVSRLVIGVLTQTLQNEMIVTILTLGISFILATIYYSIMGSLAYFSVHKQENEITEKQMGSIEEESDILDQ